MKMKKAEAQVKAREQVRGAALVEIQMISGEQQVKKEKKGEKKRNTTQILKAQIVSVMLRK